MINLHLFPTVVGIRNIGREIKKEEIEALKFLSFKQNKNNAVSERTHVFRFEEFHDIENFCECSINSFFQDIFKPINPLKIVITQSWINITRENESHHRHHHPNSFLSGVFYIETNPEDSITFYNPVKNMTDIDSKEYTFSNSQVWSIPAKQGSLIMFPSHIDHSVEAKRTEGNRISLSFNTALVGELGSIQKLTQLSLKDPL